MLPCLCLEHLSCLCRVATFRGTQLTLLLCLSGLAHAFICTTLARSQGFAVMNCGWCIVGSDCVEVMLGMHISDCQLWNLRPSLGQGPEPELLDDGYQCAALVVIRCFRANTYIRELWAQQLETVPASWNHVPIEPLVRSAQVLANNVDGDFLELHFCHIKRTR